MNLHLVALILVGRVLLFGPAEDARSAPSFGPAAEQLSIPHPPLDALEPSVAEQIRRAQIAVDQSADTPRPRAADVAEAYGSLARIYHVYEFVEAAEAAYTNATRLAAGDVRWHHLLGYLYQQTGRLQDAAAQFIAARRASPADHAATLRLGQVYLGLDRLREARELFDGVAPIYPALAQHGLGEIALRERRYGDAVTHFAAALERVPQATSIHYQLAMAYRGLGRQDEARSHLALRGPGDLRVGDPIVDALQALVTGERGLVIQGQRAYEAGDFDAAAAAFDKAVGAVPTSAAARAGLRQVANQLVRLGRRDDAVAVLIKLRSVDPDEEDALVGLAILLADAQRYREAVSLLDEAHRRLPGRLTTMTTLARLLASSPERAVRDGGRAIELAMAVYGADPAPVHAETVAMSLVELKRCTEAREWMQRAIAAAEGAGDAPEVGRLRGELWRYDTATCGL